METAKVLEILSKHIIKLEEELFLKNYEIKSLKSEIKTLKEGTDK